jgi:integrase
MKAGREHRVPLPPRCVELLKQTKLLAAGSEFVFPGAVRQETDVEHGVAHDHAPAGLGLSVHGFRSAFRNWASERTNFAREICEAALAHIVKDKTEAAYRRGDLFDKRRELMDRWAKFVEGTTQN